VRCGGKVGTGWTYPGQNYIVRVVLIDSIARQHCCASQIKVLTVLLLKNSLRLAAERRRTEFWFLEFLPDKVRNVLIVHRGMTKLMRGWLHSVLWHNCLNELPNSQSLLNQPIVCQRLR
jgi:hypothetical protein